jgi:hypothetical protein
LERSVWREDHDHLPYLNANLSGSDNATPHRALQAPFDKAVSLRRGATTQGSSDIGADNAGVMLILDKQLVRESVAQEHAALTAASRDIKIIWTDPRLRIVIPSSTTPIGGMGRISQDVHR